MVVFSNQFSSSALDQQSGMLLFKCLVAVNSYDLLLTWKSRWQDDGLSSMDSLGLKVLSRVSHKLYTNITVDIGQPPFNRPEVIVSHQSIFWSDFLLIFTKLDINDVVIFAVSVFYFS